MNGKKLVRSRTDKKIAGVCGGLGDYFGIDPLWIRLAFVLVFFAGGSSLLAYIVMWIIMPEAPEYGSAIDAPVLDSRPAEPRAAGGSNPLGDDVTEQVERAVERATGVDGGSTSK